MINVYSNNFRKILSYFFPMLIYHHLYFFEMSGLESVFVFLSFCCIMIWLANINGYGLNYDFNSLNSTLKTAKADASSGSIA